MSRADKYLWAVRIYKTRSEAAEACKNGRVKVNGVEAKSSREIKSGDIIDVRKGFVNFKYEVIEPIDKRVGAKLAEEAIRNITPQEELDKLNAPKESIFLYRDRGTGRPTKKERREMDSLLDTFYLDDES